MTPNRTKEKIAKKKEVSRPRGAEAIDMRALRFGYFPRTFVWRGHEYQVEAVELCWTTASRRNGGQMDRHYFKVRCAEGTFDVFQDLSHNTWHITHGVVSRTDRHDLAPQEADASAK